MSFFYLLRGRFMNLKFGIFPCIMLLFATVRTLFSGEAIMLTGLCMAFLPFFSQQKNTTCFAIDVSEEKEMLSTYLMDYILMFVGLGYLYLLTIIGQKYIPGYVVNDMLLETFLLVLLCNLVFINILVPLTYALDSLQRLTVGALLCIVEMAFMHFAMFALHTMGDAFVLTEQVWLYVLMLIIPMTTVEFTFLRWWQKRKLKNEEEINEHQKLVEIAIEAHTKKDE
ncbi:MAG: hypothetical protein II239_05305 [Peptococcaceae bacterium]|nr:hypothetical protein [Peptococcaceae bacterium]